MTTARTSRWFRPTPGRFLFALLAVEALLWLSERFHWIAWHKGYAVLVAVASVGVAALVLLAWFAMALVLRRRFQFSIRSLLILTVAVALPSRWLAVEMQKAKEQRQSVEAFVTYGVVAEQTEPRAPLCLRKVFGDDFFADVVGVLVWTHLGEFTDADLEHVRGLSRLKGLDLHGTHVTSAGLEHIEWLTELQGLNLTLTRVSDAGLEHLEGLGQLRWLDLSGTKVTPEGVKKLQQALPNCKIIGP